MGHIERMDLVLKWFAMDVSEYKTGKIIPRTFVNETDALTDIVDTFPQLNNHEFMVYSRQYLEKLVRDTYLTLEHGFYGITLEGLLFSSDGGYAALDKLKTLQKQQAELDLSLRKRNERHLVIGTYAVAIGAVLLALWEMYKFFFLEKH